MEREIAALCRGVGRIYGDWYELRARVLGEYISPRVAQGSGGT